mmetsp:Transcript_7222/g.24600  ORF Transcript_7222/g.24600 Transcript_7222/m.24600 type:complete len:341 (+) Transcript_7222:437-1459(+)
MMPCAYAVRVKGILQAFVNMWCSALEFLNPGNSQCQCECEVALAGPSPTARPGPGPGAGEGFTQYWQWQVHSAPIVPSRPGRRPRAAGGARMGPDLPAPAPAELSEICCIWRCSGPPPNRPRPAAPRVTRARYRISPDSLWSSPSHLPCTLPPLRMMAQKMVGLRGRQRSLPCTLGPPQMAQKMVGLRGRRRLSSMHVVSTPALPLLAHFFLKSLGSRYLRVSATQLSSRPIPWRASCTAANSLGKWDGATLKVPWGGWCAPLPGARAALSITSPSGVMPVVLRFMCSQATSGLPGSYHLYTSWKEHRMEAPSARRWACSHRATCLANAVECSQSECTYW